MNHVNSPVGNPRFHPEVADAVTAPRQSFTWLDTTSSTFVSGYVVQFDVPQTPEALLERIFGTKPSTWATEPEAIRAAYDADPRVKYARRYDLPGPLLALQHSFEDGLSDSLDPSIYNGKCSCETAVNNVAFDIGHVVAGDPTTRYLPDGNVGITIPFTVMPRAGPGTIYGLHRVEPRGDHDSYADVERTPFKVPALHKLPKLAPGDRYKLQTGRYNPLVGRFGWTKDRSATWESGEPGELMEVARVARLENRDGFEWRVFDTTTGESIDALADPSRPLPLPPGWPLPVVFASVGASPWLLAKWQRERKALAVPRSTSNFEHGLELAGRMQQGFPFGNTATPHSNNAEPFPTGIWPVTKYIFGRVAVALLGAFAVLLLIALLLSR